MASDDEDSDEDAGDDVVEDSDVTDDDDGHQPAKLISLAMVKKWTKKLQVSLMKRYMMKRCMIFRFGHLDLDFSNV